MTVIRKLLFFIVAAFAFIVALLAGADNSDEVALRFLEWQSMTLPVSAWILMTFLIGLLFGSMLNLLTNTRLRLDARSAKKTVATRTRELDQVRAEKTETETAV